MTRASAARSSPVPDGPVRSLQATRRPARPRAGPAPVLGGPRRLGGHAFEGMQVQAPTVAVSRPGDAVESEADSIAASLTAGRRAMPAARGRVRSPLRASASVVGGLGPGRPLDGDIRAAVEPRLGMGLGHVRVHDDAAAAESARSLDARAYTFGHRIVFGRSAYAPRSPGGGLLLAHELAHVAQQQRQREPAIMRQACGHDGRQTGCGGGGLARWRLTDIATSAVTEEALDTIVIRGVSSRFGGRWATQVQTPPNPVKAGRERGRADGVKVTIGSALRVEVVEVKARSTQFHGGCLLATREAQGYVTVLRAIAPAVARIAQALAPRGGMRVEGSLNTAQRRALIAAGIDVGDPVTAEAWKFYNSLQNTLGLTFRTPFTSVDVDVNADGTANTTYPVMSVAMECRTRRGRTGVKARTLAFQVNLAGGVSYGCSDTSCQDEEEERQRQVQQQPVARPVARPADQVEDHTVPILVGAGTGVALTAAATVALRRRAAQIAARRALQEVERRAAQAAWRRAAEEAAARRAARTAGGRVAGRAAARAVAYAEIAAAVALVTLYSDRASAAPGPGQSSLEALYQAMSQSGAPPSPELRRMIEEDPVLRDMAERAGQTGDAGPLQDAITQRVIQLVRDNPDQFTPEDLEALTHMQHAAGAGGGSGPANAEQLRAAIEQARSGRPGGGAAGTPGAGTGGERRADATGPTAATGSGGVRPGATGAGGAEAHPGLSAPTRQSLAAAPAPVRSLFDRMVARGGMGTRVTDDFVARYLATVPADLSADESRRLAERLRPADTDSADEAIARLASAVEGLRARREAQRRAAAAARPATGSGGEADRARAPRPPAARDPSTGLVPQMLRVIQAYGGWDAIGEGAAIAVADWSPSGPITAQIYGRTPARNGVSVRYTAQLQVRVVRRSGNRMMVRILSATAAVAENGNSVQLYRAGQEWPFDILRSD